MLPDQTELGDTSLMLPDWATQNTDNAVYTFPQRQSDYRIRRLESALQYNRRGSAVATSSSFQAVSTDATTAAGAINLTSASGLVVKGSVPPIAVVGTFGYTSDTSSIHLYWDGTNSSVKFVIKRADGTSFSVPKGDKNITGLSANTTYYFYPFWNVISNGPAVSFAIGTVGTPKLAFTAKSTAALATQNQLGHEGLAQGPISAATQAAGNGGGTGGGTPCVLAGTDIEMLVPSWTYKINELPQSQWVLVNSPIGSVTVVPTHRFYRPDGYMIEARNLRPGDWLVHKSGDIQIDAVDSFETKGIKWQVVMPKGHIYFANGFLSHNMKLGG